MASIRNIIAGSLLVVGPVWAENIDNLGSGWNDKGSLHPNLRERTLSTVEHYDSYNYVKNEFTPEAYNHIKTLMQSRFGESSCNGSWNTYHCTDNSSNTTAHLTGIPVDGILQPQTLNMTQAYGKDILAYDYVLEIVSSVVDTASQRYFGQQDSSPPTSYCDHLDPLYWFMGFGSLLCAYYGNDCSMKDGLSCSNGAQESSLVWSIGPRDVYYLHKWPKWGLENSFTMDITSPQPS